MSQKDDVIQETCYLVQNSMFQIQYANKKIHHPFLNNH